MDSRYREAVIVMAKDGATIEQIMLELGCSKQTVYTHWPPDVPTPHMKKTADESADVGQTIITLRDMGWSQGKIAKKLNMSVSGIHRVISRYNSSVLSRTYLDQGQGASPNPPPTPDQGPFPQ